MERIILKPIKSKKQLKALAKSKILKIGFVDEKEQFFNVVFELENGNKQDLSIVFETRTPKVFLSCEYHETTKQRGGGNSGKQKDVF